MMDYGQQDQRLKIELPSPPVSPPEEMRHILSTPTNNTDDDDDEDGLNVINYPLTLDDSSTIRHLMRQYGFESSRDDDNYADTDDPSSQIDTYTITQTNDIGTTTIATSTVGGPSSFPDLSYNQFQQPLPRPSATTISSIHTQTNNINNNNGTNKNGTNNNENTLHNNNNNKTNNKANSNNNDSNKQQPQQHEDTNNTQQGVDSNNNDNNNNNKDSDNKNSNKSKNIKFQTRGNGKLKRRSHSAMLSLTDNTSTDKPPPFQSHKGRKSRVPIDRPSAKGINITNIITNSNGGIQYTKLLQPRRLSLSVSSMTSEASYSRYGHNNNHSHNHNNPHHHQRTRSGDTITSMELESITKTFGGGNVASDTPHSLTFRNISRIDPHSNTQQKIKRIRATDVINQTGSSSSSQSSSSSSSASSNSSSSASSASSLQSSSASSGSSGSSQSSCTRSLTLSKLRDTADQVVDKLMLKNDGIVSNTLSSALGTVRINHHAQNTMSKTTNQLAPLLDAYEPFGGASTVTLTTPSGDPMGIETNSNSNNLIPNETLSRDTSSEDDEDSSTDCDDDEEEESSTDSEDINSCDDTMTDTSTTISTAIGMGMGMGMGMTMGFGVNAMNVGVGATTNNKYNHIVDGGYDEMQLEKSINEFFNVIDSAGMGSVNFDILKICLKLLGIDLSAYQLDILLNELTGYKPSLPISKEMMYEFLLLYDMNNNKKKRKHTDNLQVTLIRTEIIVGLLANLQTTFANQTGNHSKKSGKSDTKKKKKKSNKSKKKNGKNKTGKKKKKNGKTKRRSFISKSSSKMMQQYLDMNRINQMNQYFVNSPKSKSRRASSKLDYQSSTKKNHNDNNYYLNHNPYKHDPPYIVTKSRRKKNGHNRFHSDGNILNNTVDTNSDNISSTSTLTITNNNNISNKNPHRKPPQIRRHPPSPQHKLAKLANNKSSPVPKLPLAPNSSNLPPLPATPLSHKRHSTPRNMTPRHDHNEDYNQWLLICFKNSIIDSLMELLYNDELRVYVFDDTMISHHMIGNDALSAIEYLFECQFAFMSNGSAYLDFNGFAAGMRKCNIHFETPEIAIPLIFEQLVGINNGDHNKKKKKKTKIDYNHVFIAEDTFVEWMMNYIRIHINTNPHHGTNQFDERIDKLFNIIQVIYNQSKYNKYMQQQQQQKHKKSKKKRKSSPTKLGKTDKVNVTNPFEVESLYARSPSMAQQRQIKFNDLGLPPKPRHNEYHQHTKHSIPSINNSTHNSNNTKQFYDTPPIPNIQSLHHAQTNGSKRKHKSVKPLRNSNNHALYNSHNSHNSHKYKPYKSRNETEEEYYTEY